MDHHGTSHRMSALLRFFPVHQARTVCRDRRVRQWRTLLARADQRILAFCSPTVSSAWIDPQTALPRITV